MTKVFIVVGEASGDALGAALVAGLRELEPSVEITGLAGPRMQAEGLTSLFPMEELSVMGLAEVLPKYPHLRRRMLQTVEAVLAARPDVLLTIDAPDFSLRVAKRVRAADPAIRTVHYVAPSVWAWRPGRAAKMARFVDQVLALLPFEPSYMEAAGMRCDFVGHPVTTAPVASAEDAAAFRARIDVGQGPLILALPGSRRGEVTRLADVFGESLARVADVHPEAQFVLPAAPAVVDLLRERTTDWPRPLYLIDPADDPDGSDKRAAFAAADVALAASGTVSLELAAADTPMVIAYDMAWLTRQILRRMLRVDTVTLVNLVSDTRVVPEFLADNCTADRIAPALLNVLADPGAQQKAARLTMERLGRGGELPGTRAARAVLDGLASTGGGKNR
ncbi:MAG: lipid-A-disaccharide synthase [Rhodobacteraceae bacterium]|nr:lipid-A-disaccharide synthase [Paracoccaceae bacterium]